MVWQDFITEVIKQFLAVCGGILTALWLARLNQNRLKRNEEISRINILIMDMSTRRILDKELQNLGQLNRDPSQDGEWSKRSVFALRDTIKDARQALLPKSPLAEPLSRMSTYCNDWLEKYEWPNSDFKKLLAELSDNIYKEIEIIWQHNKKVHDLKPGSNSISPETRELARLEAIRQHGHKN